MARAHRCALVVDPGGGTPGASPHRHPYIFEVTYGSASPMLRECWAEATRGSEDRLARWCVLLRHRRARCAAGGQKRRS
ncbi:hypothetical protein [Streptomyces sp. RB17]|uniref:hypothetical protein n=1 Tax=Streptomyces sp. RB17 TaxID=2585197 RepID=UPI0012959F2A|nr:hypothetical protein [Streptomyces sp. RB17]